MKKIIALLLALVMVLSLAACGKKEDTANLQDEVISSLIELSKTKPNDETTLKIRGIKTSRNTRNEKLGIREHTIRVIVYTSTPVT